MAFLKLQTLMLRLLCWSTQPNENIAWKIVSWLHWALLATISCTELHFVIVNMANIPLATDALCTLLTCVLSLSKMFTMNVNRNKHYKMIWTLREMWSKSIMNLFKSQLRPQDVFTFVAPKDDERFLYDAYKSDYQLTLPYIISTVMVGILYMAFPIALSTSDFIMTGNATWKMPMKSVYVRQHLYS